MKTTLPSTMPGNADKPIFTADLPECQGVQLTVHMGDGKTGPEGEQWTPEVQVRVQSENASRVVVSGIPETPFWYAREGSAWVFTNRNELGPDADLLDGVAGAFIESIVTATEKGKHLWADVVKDPKNLNSALDATRAWCSQQK